MSQSSSYPRTFARAVSFAYKALQTLSLSSRALLKSFWLSEAPGGTLFKIASPHSLSPVCLVTMSSTLHLITHLFLVLVFHYKQVISSREVFCLFCSQLCPQHPEQCQASHGRTTDMCRVIRVSKWMIECMNHPWKILRAWKVEFVLCSWNQWFFSLGWSLKKKYLACISWSHWIKLNDKCVLETRITEQQGRLTWKRSWGSETDLPSESESTYLPLEHRITMCYDRRIHATQNSSVFPKELNLYQLNVMTPLDTQV